MTIPLNPVKLLDLGESGDLATYTTRLVDLTHDLGFPLVSGVVISGRYADPNPKIRPFGVIPKGYESIATNMSDARRDPVLTSIASGAKPVVYRQQTYIDAGLGEQWEEQRTFGYANGIAMQLQLDSERALTIGVDTGDTLTSEPAALKRLIAGFQLIATNAAAAAEQLFKPAVEISDLPTLTARELDVMRWTLAGKTAWEVGKIMNLGESTIRFHTANAIRKLGVTSKHQAAWKCKSLGLIS